MLYIFDIDGTLADSSERVVHLQGEKKDWDSFYQGLVRDKPLALCELARDLIRCGNGIVLITGRSEEHREDTMTWLKMHSIKYDRLYMRPDGDRRPDYIVKKEVTEFLLREGLKIAGIFEDRNQNVRMWRDMGLTVYQVADGDF